MTTTTDLLPNKLRMTAGIEDMAGRPYTAGQLREAADTIASLERERDDYKAEYLRAHRAANDLFERAEAAERERDELRAKWAPLVKWAAAKEKAEQGLREAHWTEEAIAALSGKEE